MKLALIGVGLIGGSFAAALRAAGVVGEVIGYDPDPRAVALAAARDIITRSAPSAAEAVRGTDLVVIATPVGATRASLAAIVDALMPNAIVTDVGSTKASVIDDARAALGSRLQRFVPAHPIAGGERPGVEHADAALFRGRLVITTPTPQTDAEALSAVEALWRAAGARVERLDAAIHDEVFAAVSHLPHVLAFTLVEMIAAGEDAAMRFAHAGAGFRDFTRIAASSPQMWRDVCLANRVALAAELRRYRARLESLQHAIDTSNGAELERVFAVAAAARRNGDSAKGEDQLIRPD